VNNRLDFLVASNQESESQWKKAVGIALHQSFFHAVIQVPSFNQCVVIRHQQCLEYQNQMEVVVTIKVKRQKEEDIHQRNLHCQYPEVLLDTYLARPEGPLYLLEIRQCQDAQINGEV